MDVIDRFRHFTNNNITCCLYYIMFICTYSVQVFHLLAICGINRSSSLQNNDNFECPFPISYFTLHHLINFIQGNACGLKLLFTS